jgi:DNA-binding transcriptional LysR family regulator
MFYIFKHNVLLTMDSRFLETLITVLDCGSLAEAGRRLNMTSAGIAQRIHALEVEIGAALLLRSGRSVRPTPAAAAILEQTRRLVADVRDLKSVATSGLLTGEIRIGVIPTTLSGLLPDLLIPFTSAHPKIDVRIVRDHSTALYQKLLDGEIDTAITSHPPFTIPKTCGWLLLRQEPFLLLTSRSLRMRNPHEILKREPFIRLTRQVYAGQLIDEYLKKVRIQPNERFELDGFELIAMMVDRGVGVALLPDWPRPWPEGLTLRKLRLPDSSFVRKIGILWRRSSLRLKLIEALVKGAQAQATRRPSSAAL